MSVFASSSLASVFHKNRNGFCRPIIFKKVENTESWKVTGRSRKVSRKLLFNFCLHKNAQTLELVKKAESRKVTGRSRKVSRKLSRKHHFRKKVMRG